MINFLNHFRIRKKQEINDTKTDYETKRKLKFRGNKRDTKRLYKSMSREDKLNNIEEIFEGILNNDDYDDYDKVKTMQDLYSLLDERDRVKKMPTIYRKILASELSDQNKENAIIRLYQMLDENNKKNKISIVIQQILATELSDYNKENTIIRLYQKLKENDKKNKISTIIQHILVARLSGFDKKYIILRLYQTLDGGGRESSISFIVESILESNLSRYDKNDSIKMLYMELEEKDKRTRLIDIMKQILNCELSKTDKLKYIINIWKECNSEVQIENLTKVIEYTLKSEIIESEQEKEEFIEELIRNLQNEVIKEDFDILLSKINSIRTRNKIDLYISVVFLIESIDGKKTAHIERVMQELQKQEIPKKQKEKLDFKDIDSFKRSIAIRSLSKGDLDEWSEKEKSERKFIIRCINEMFNDNPETILEYDPILKFFDAIVHKVIKKDKSLDLIVQKYNDLISGLKEPKNIKVFDEMLERNGFISQDIMEDFVDYITLIRLKETKMPSRYYKYILKEAILGNIDKHFYEEIIKMALVDFTQDHLRSLGITDNAISFGKIKKKNTVGTYRKDGYIKISDVYLRKRNITGVINTCFHECRHAEHRRLIKENKYNKKIYAILKEKIISEHDVGFYRRNYYTMENEIDARMYACIQTYKFLLDIGLTPKQIAIYEEENLYDEIEYDSKSERSLKRDIENNERNIDSIIIDILNQENVKGNVLEEYPILQLEYEKDEKGNIRKKDKTQIEMEYKEVLNMSKDEDERKRIEGIYEYIINGEKEIEDGNYTEYLMEEGYEISDEILEGIRVQETSFEEFVQVVQTPLEDKTKVKSIKKFYKNLRKEERISNIEEAVRQVLYSDLKITYDKKECIKELFKLLEEDKVSQIGVVIQLILDDLEEKVYTRYFIEEIYQMLEKEERAEKINDVIQLILESNCEEFEKKEIIERLYTMLDKKDRIEKKEQITQQLLDSNFSEHYKAYFIYMLSENGNIFSAEEIDEEEGLSEDDKEVLLFFKEDYYKHTPKERMRVNKEIKRQISIEKEIIV